MFKTPYLKIHDRFNLLIENIDLADGFFNNLLRAIDSNVIKLLIKFY